MNAITPFPELDALLGDLTASAQAILEGISSGRISKARSRSATRTATATSTFSSSSSVISRPAQVESLQTMHERLHDGPIAWAQNLEGSYFPRARLRQHTEPTSRSGTRTTGVAVLERSDHDDTLVVRWCLREYGIVLAGRRPAPSSIPFPRDALKAEVRATMRSWARTS